MKRVVLLVGALTGASLAPNAALAVLLKNPAQNVVQNLGSNTAPLSKDPTKAYTDVTTWAEMQSLFDDVHTARPAAADNPGVVGELVLHGLVPQSCYDQGIVIDNTAADGAIASGDTVGFRVQLSTNARQCIKDFRAKRASNDPSGHCAPGGSVACMNLASISTSHIVADRISGKSPGYCALQPDTENKFKCFYEGDKKPAPLLSRADQQKYEETDAQKRREALINANRVILEKCHRNLAAREEALKFLEDNQDLLQRVLGKRFDLNRQRRSLRIDRLSDFDKRIAKAEESGSTEKLDEIREDLRAFYDANLVNDEDGEKVQAMRNKVGELYRKIEHAYLGMEDANMDSIDAARDTLDDALDLCDGGSGLSTVECRAIRLEKKEGIAVEKLKIREEMGQPVNMAEFQQLAMQLNQHAATACMRAEMTPSRGNGGASYDCSASSAYLNQLYADQAQIAQARQQTMQAMQQRQNMGYITPQNIPPALATGMRINGNASLSQFFGQSPGMMAGAGFMPSLPSTYALGAPGQISLPGVSPLPMGYVPNASYNWNSPYPQVNSSLRTANQPYVRL